MLGLLSASLLFPVRYYLNRSFSKGSPLADTEKKTVSVTPKVIQVQHAGVCSWNYGQGSYIDSINYKSVKKMLDAGLLAISGVDEPAAAWKKIIQPYERGDRIVIKPNLNNTIIGYSQAIMTSPQVTRAVVESLLESGYPAADIIIYDLTAYKDQKATGVLVALGVETVFLKQNPTVLDKVAIKFNLGPEAADRTAPVNMSSPVRDDNGNDVKCYMPKVLTKAQHLINVPVFKAHQFVLQSSALKNHFGTVRFSNHNSHPVVLHGAHIDQHIADINANPHIKNKTRLTIVDALLGASCFLRGEHGRKPTRWRTLSSGDTPSSLYLSKDPIALESVMGDMIIKEQQSMGYVPHSHEYLHIASQLGLGIHEHSDSDKYNRIDFKHLSI